MKVLTIRGGTSSPLTRIDQEQIAMKNTATASAATGAMAAPCSLQKKYELALWIILIAAVNISLLFGSVPELFIFDVEEVKLGQLWRIVTYPLAHVSIYHLLMDASAFLMLYAGMEEKTTNRRLLYTACCGMGSLLFSLLFSPAVCSIGLSGLSGIAHGLMAVTGMELIKNHRQDTALFRTGWVVLAVVTIKSLLEAWTGEVIFSSLHLGSIGIPVAETHLGGVIGGVGAFIVLNRKKVKGEKS